MDIGQWVGLLIVLSLVGVAVNLIVQAVAERRQCAREQSNKKAQSPHASVIRIQPGKPRPISPLASLSASVAEAKATPPWRLADADLDGRAPDAKPSPPPKRQLRDARGRFKRTPKPKRGKVRA